jgi:6-phosphofructo-2-kinase
VIERLKPVIMELERMRVDIMVVTHRILMKTLLAYFVGIQLEDIPRIDVPMHTVYKIDPKPYGADILRYEYDDETREFICVGQGIGKLESK